MQELKPYSYAFVWYYNTCFDQKFNLGEQFLTALRDINAGSYLGVGTLRKSDLEELRCDSWVDRDELEKKLQRRLYEELEIADTPHMIRKILMKNEIPFYVTKDIYETDKKINNKIPSRVFLTNETMYSNFQENCYEYFTLLRNQQKCFVQISKSDFMEALCSYKFRVPRLKNREFYARSRKLSAMHSIVENDMFPMFKEKYPEAFASASGTTELIKSIQMMFSIEYSEHAKDIAVELRRLNEAV